MAGRCGFAILRSRAGLASGPSQSHCAAHSAAHHRTIDGSGRDGFGGAREPNLWRVRSDFEDVLRAMQRSADRQKMLTAHGELMSDERLPLVVLDVRSLTA